MNQTNIAVLIPAAGIGSRFKSIIPKQYYRLGGSTVLEQTVNSFTSHYAVKEVILAIAPSDMFCKRIVFENHEKVKIIKGGNTRQISVSNCLALVSEEIEYIIVHDAVRPFFSINPIIDQIKHLYKYDGAIPVVSISDSLRSGDSMQPVDRNNFFAVQTPQIFKKIPLQDSFTKKLSDEIDFTDESQLLEFYGYKIKFFDGDEANKKITYAADLFSSSSIDNRFGRGIDYHLYESGTGFRLGGVDIPSEYSIISHSDGDVLLHSLADAILGSIGLRDIGFYFPDTDASNKDLDSKIILTKSMTLLKKHTYKLRQIEITIVCGLPKISPYVDEIKKSLSKLCELPIEDIAIKSTTTEGLGGVGHDKGIAVFSLVSICK